MSARLSERVDRGNATTSVHGSGRTVDRVSVVADPAFGELSARDCADNALEALTGEGWDYEAASSAIRSATCEPGEAIGEAVYLLRDEGKKR